MNLALFDLDNTLLATDSDFEWAQFLIEQGVLDREIQEARNIEFYEHYKAGTLDIQAFLDFQMQPLAHHTRQQLDAWHEKFMTRHIRPHIAQGASALIEQHRAAGDLLAIVTATNSFVTGPIARELGIAHLIATIPGQDSRSGRYTGKPVGTPAFRTGKIARTEAWLESLGLWWGSFQETRFYSDSHNDLPLLEQVSHPVAVDPDDNLRAHAQRLGWPVISLRQ
ncbi:MAG: HAD family hydrolase [Sterolibacterium sp.]|jgi:HAD superfamily hydrolase (TIGR01490 family)|nr:HAD family hydrolase [Sterolibacterium sp.]